MPAASVRESVVIVEVVRADAGRLAVEVELMLDGARTSVASWLADDVADRTPVVVVVRSPDRGDAAVLVGRVLSRVDLELGTVSLVDADVSWPDCCSAEVVWTGDGPRVTTVDANGPRRLPLTDGRELVLDASVWADDGLSGGDQGSMAGVAMPMGTSPEDAARARDELHASLDDAALAERREWARVEGPHPPAVLFDELASGAYGTTNVHWPASVGQSGAIVRTSTTRVTGGGSAATEIDRPWFVRADGSIERLEVRLGNAPLCELRDGRWLLGGADELWCDAGNEPLHALGLDGRLTPWNPDAPISTTSILEVVAPEILPPTPPENLDDWPWLIAARLTDDRDRVVLLITEQPWLPTWEPDCDLAWAAVALPADGRGTPALVAEGRRTALRFSTVAL